MIKRKLRLSLLAMGSTVMLIACNADTEESSKDAVDITEFSFVEFSGKDGEGRASHGFDQKKFMEEVFNYDDANGPADEETVKEMDLVDDAMTVSLDKQNGLSNGDTVVLKVEVDESKTDKVKDAEKTFKVSGLEE